MSFKYNHLRKMYFKFSRPKGIQDSPHDSKICFLPKLRNYSELKFIL